VGYDKHHSNADRICRVLRESRFPDGRSQVLLGTSGPLAGVLRQEIPEVEASTRRWRTWTGFRHNDRVLRLCA
jgi:putative ABC transport system permease protein